MLVPFDAIPDAAWRALQKGADEPSHPMHLLTLATVAEDGRPSARLMVNRGADRETGRLWMHTDALTPKVGDLRVNPYACISAWDAHEGVHLRVHGRVLLHQHDAVANRHWEQMSRAAQWIYAAERETVEADGEPPDLRLPRDKRQLPHKLTARERDHFVVIEVWVESIDWLQALRTEQRRAVLRGDEHWVAMPA